MDLRQMLIALSKYTHAHVQTHTRVQEKYVAYEKRSFILTLNIAQLIDASSVKNTNFKLLILQKATWYKHSSCKDSKISATFTSNTQLPFPLLKLQETFWKQYLDQWDCVLIAFDILSTKEGKTCSSCGIGLPKQYLCKP